MSLLSARDCFLNAVLFIVCFLFFFLSYWMTNTLYQIMWKKNVYIHQIIIVQITYHFLNFRDGNHTRICVIDIRTRFFFFGQIFISLTHSLSIVMMHLFFFSIRLFVVVVSFESAINSRTQKSKRQQHNDL